MPKVLLREFLLAKTLLQMVVLLYKHSGRITIIGATVFPVETKVEVQRSNIGIKGVWYEAIVFKVHPQGRRFDVVYTVTDDEPLHPHNDDDDFALPSHDDLQPIDTQDQERMIQLFESKLDQQCLLWQSIFLEDFLWN